jgi:hypothetical protein
MAGSGDMDGQQIDWTSVNVYSPDGTYTDMELDMGMLVWSQSQLITSADDGTTLMQVNHNGAQMLMNSATDFSSLNNMNDDDGDHSSDDVLWEMFSYCEWEGDSSTDGDTRWDCSEDNQDGSDGFDDWWYLCELDSQDGIWYCSDDFGQSPDWANTANDTRHSGSVISDDGDMSDDSTDNMDLPSVDIPDSFDPSTALFEAGLATDNGYSFSTTMDDGMGYSMTMTFAFGMDLVVNSMTLTETMDGESSTSSITILEESIVTGYLTLDTTLPYHALPFEVSPMGGIGSGDNDMGDNGDDGMDDNGNHGSMFDWMISETQDMPMEGSFDDYTITLAMCTMDDSNDDGMDMGMGTTPTMDCSDDVLIVTIADAMTQDAVVMFHDADMSGTISQGDMVHINPDIDVDGWNTVRLYSTSANSYSDENPMLTPGFTGALGMLALLGAALLTRRD